MDQQVLSSFEATYQYCYSPLFYLATENAFACVFPKWMTMDNLNNQTEGPTFL